MCCPLRLSSDLVNVGHGGAWIRRGKVRRGSVGMRDVAYDRRYPFPVEPDDTDTKAAQAVNAKAQISGLEVEKRGRTRFNTARRAFALLDLISLREGLTAKVLSKELGVSLSTCYSLINILIEKGFVEKAAHQKGYKLGPAVSLLHARSHKIDLESRVEPVLEELATRSERHAYFGLLSGGDAIVAQVKSPCKKPPVDIVRGSLAASHALAVGKILIASNGAAGIDEYVDEHGLRMFTPRTITDPKRFKVHLAEVRRLGFAIDVEEFAENLCCVATPVTDGGGRVEGTIGISTTSLHFYKESEALIELVLKYARKASALLA